MKVLTAALYGLVAATGVVAQGNDDTPDLLAQGPFALRVKGHCNSSIDGYLHAVDTYSYTEPQMVLHYDARQAPVAGNSSYRFYTNYTGAMQSNDGAELGLLVSDITVGELNERGLRGKAMAMQYRPNTNVALPALVTNVGTVDLTGFDKDGKGFLNYYTDDADAVPEKPANVSLSVDYYDGWAICWQTYFAITGPTLSWITAGKAHNPTCERVDLIKTEL